MQSEIWFEIPAPSTCSPVIKGRSFDLWEHLSSPLTWRWEYCRAEMCDSTQRCACLGGPQWKAIAGITFGRMCLLVMFGGTDKSCHKEARFHCVWPSVSQTNVTPMRHTALSRLTPCTFIVPAGGWRCSNGGLAKSGGSAVPRRDLQTPED